MKILGVDTAGPVASVALVDDGRLVAEEFCGRARAHEQDPWPPLQGQHAENLLPMIQSVVARSRCRFEQLAGLAVSIGPGSFTGLRIGLATVKGLAYGTSLPAVGVSTLLATAACARKHRGLICSMLDARKREVYAALFLREGEQLTRLTEDAVLPFSRAIACVQSNTSVDAREVLFIGDGAVAYESLLLEALGPVTIAPAGCCSVAASVAVLGLDRFRQFSGGNLAELAPVYLRSAEAENRRPGTGVTY